MLSPKAMVTLWVGWQLMVISGSIVLMQLWSVLMSKTLCYYQSPWGCLWAELQLEAMLMSKHCSKLALCLTICGRQVN